MCQVKVLYSQAKNERVSGGIETMTIYQIVTAIYYVIVLYFAAMILWQLVTEKALSKQVAIAIAMVPFLYRLLYIK
jgi:uncharacterized membrane protein